MHNALLLFVGHDHAPTTSKREPVVSHAVQKYLTYRQASLYTLLMFIGPYKRLIARSPNLLGFGFMMVFFSSMGQTYFVGVFGPQIQSEFNLSHTAWSSVYMIGTLASAMLFFWSGPLIDRYKLPGFTRAVCILMVVACAFMPFVSGPVTLVLGIFLLRHSGQALASHVGVTSMGRYFDRGRGRAIAIASLGQSAGEAVLPFLAVAAIAVVGWRWTYAGVAVILAITSLSTVGWLLRGYEKLHAKHLESLRTKTDNVKSNVVSWTRKMVLRDIRFYLLLPAMTATSMIVTAFFFHHLTIAEVKQWDARWITGNYLLYAGASMAATLFAGSLIDRFRARFVIRFIMIPLALAALTIGIADHYLWVLLYMILMGLHVGFSHTSASALYPELYGVEYLGSIKSMVGVFSVLSSAIGPVLIGMLFDRGIPIQTICIVIAIYVVACNMLLILALRIVPTFVPQPTIQNKTSS